MSGNRFVMRRDTQKHLPPRPAAPPPARHARPPRPAEGEARDFWKEEERRHARLHPPGADGAHTHG